MNHGLVIPLKRTCTPREEEGIRKKRSTHMEGGRDGRRSSKRVRGRGDLLEKEIEDQEEALSDLVTEVSHHLSQMGFLGELLGEVQDCSLMRQLALALTCQEGLVHWNQESSTPDFKPSSLPGKAEWTDPLVEWMGQARERPDKSDPQFPPLDSLIPFLNRTNSGVLQCIYRFLWSLFGPSPTSSIPAWRFLWPEQLLPVVVRLIYRYMDDLLHAWISLPQDFPPHDLPEAVLGVAELLLECQSAFPTLGPQTQVDWLEELDRWSLQCARFGLSLKDPPIPSQDGLNDDQMHLEVLREPPSHEWLLRRTWLQIRRTLWRLVGLEHVKSENNDQDDRHSPADQATDMQNPVNLLSLLSMWLEQCHSLLSKITSGILLVNWSVVFRVH